MNKEAIPLVWTQEFVWEVGVDPRLGVRLYLTSTYEIPLIQTEAGALTEDSLARAEEAPPLYES